MLKDHICTIVHGKTTEEFIKNLKEAQTLSPWIELRIDSLSQFQLSDLDAIFSHVTNKTIVTCRTPKYHGEYLQPDESRVAIFRHAHNLGCTLIDIEYQSKALEVVSKDPTLRSKLIVSYHNFESTPPLPDLLKLRTQMKASKPPVIKICTTVKTVEDTQGLLQIIATRTNNDPEQIVIGMGEAGRTLRIVGPLLGTYLTFAKLHHSPSSSGKLPVETMVTVYDEIDRALKTANSI